MRLFVGTSGWSYKEWKGSFYPEDLPASEMLRFYAERFSTVEVNNTFYRMPAAEQIRKWAEQVGESFRFVLKAPQRITHVKRLAGAGDDLSYFLAAAAALGERQGPVLFQLPPFLRKDAARLAEFLALVPATARVAFEFRHASWFDDEVLQALRQHEIALCLSEADEAVAEEAPVKPAVPEAAAEAIAAKPKTKRKTAVKAPRRPEPIPAIFEATAPFGYLRLRRQAYTDDDLRGWVERIRAQPWAEVFVFFKHEDAGTGPRLAARFADLFAR